MSALTKIVLQSVIALAFAWPLSACTGSEHGNPETPLSHADMTGPEAGPPPIDGGNPPDSGFGNRPNDSLGGCSRELWLRPQDERAIYYCDPIGDEFDQAPSAWHCFCGDDEPIEIEPPSDPTTRCEDVLSDICDVDVEQRNFCEHAGGTCWPSGEGDDRWDCACGASPEAGALTTVQAESCEAAAFTRCASACEDLTGRCEPRQTDRFECSCDYFAMTRDTPADRCELALAGCNPQLNDHRDADGLACSSFAGHCDEVDGELRCTCADGREQAWALSELGEASAEGCGGQLHAFCGDGAPERESFYCNLEADNGRLCYASYLFAEERYDCRCESLSACNAEYDIRESLVDGASCAEALAACKSEDDAADHPAEAPACEPDPGPRSCDGPGPNGRNCNAHVTTEGPYACTCFLNDGLLEVDLREYELEAETCAQALASCVEMDGEE